MPCYRCGTRQVDPEAGKPSPWRRGVVRDHQVLVCPACQPAALADLSRCPGCGSVHLIRRLDQVECLDCRLARDVSPEPQDPADGDSSLAADVARALRRVLGAPLGGVAGLAGITARSVGT